MNKLATQDEIDYFAECFGHEMFRTKRGIQVFSYYVASLPTASGPDPFPLFHYFAGGVYYREIHMDAGYFAVGRLHLHDCMVYMLQGKVLVCDIDGVRIVEGPCRFESKAGLKRVGYIIEPVVWIDIHRTDAETVEEAEAELFQDDYSEYELMLEELGYTPEQAQIECESAGEVLDGYCKRVYVAESSISGNGLFALPAEHGEGHEAALKFPRIPCFKAGDTIGIARVGYNRTELGRYANHSNRPNARCEVKNNSIYYVATNQIDEGDEITVDYRQARGCAVELDIMLERKSVPGWSPCHHS